MRRFNLGLLHVEILREIYTWETALVNNAFFTAFYKLWRLTVSMYNVNQGWPTWDPRSPE